MRKTVCASFSFLAFILLLSTLRNTRALVVTSSVKGARTEDLIIKFYADVEDAYQALKNGSIDILGYDLTANLYYDAINDTNIILSPVGDMGMYEFDINNNYTCIEYPGIRSPTNYLGFRQALALLTPKDRIVEEFCGGFANRLDQPIAYAQKGWRNDSYWYEDGTYPYEYDPAAAATTLDVTGFLQGTTNNTYYDPAFPGSAVKIRTYPAGHSKAGQDLDDVVVVINDADLRRIQAGDLLIQNMRKHGIPVLKKYCHYWWCHPADTHRYHVYTGGWSVSFVPWTLYGLFHSENFFLGGSNYVTGNDSAGNPNYPVLDQLLELGQFPHNLSEATSAVKTALGYFTEQCITIPLYSARSFWAWKRDLSGVVSGENVGLENSYNFYNAYKEGGGPIVYGLRSPPNKLNIIYSSWYYDYQVLDRIYEGGYMSEPPYDLSSVQPGYLKEWTTSTWVDPDDSIEKTKVTRTWRSECPGNPGEPLRFTRPVTGAQGEVVNVTQHYANLWYVKQDPLAWSHGARITGDVKTTRMTGNYTMEIYWNTPGYWNTFYGTTYLTPFNTLLSGPVSTVVTGESLSVDGNGWTTTSEPAYWITVADDTPGAGGTPLTVGTDLEMYLDTRAVPGPHKCTIRVINPAYYSTTIEVSYLAVGDAQGYTIGNVPWDQSLEGHGMFYITDHTPGVGGNVTLKRNPRYWMETPLLGEVDFIRKPNGCFKIDIFDVVMAASAYGSLGSGVPDPDWFPGADLAPPAGIVDIFDIVTITSKYGEEFDCDP